MSTFLKLLVLIQVLAAHEIHREAKPSPFSSFIWRLFQLLLRKLDIFKSRKRLGRHFSLSIHSVLKHYDKNATACKSWIPLNVNISNVIEVAEYDPV